ncbi:MAG: DUF2950 family protein [Planctomycetes bacterium]|nr:DUF2950 family protein [Planctomycetota bacterium]
MKSAKALTLVEVLIVVVIVAIILAIAIPSTSRHVIASNEAVTVAALKQLVGAEATWRQTDPDGNGIQDYWTLDVAGFYGVQDSSGSLRKLIGCDLADADESPCVSYPGHVSCARGGYKFQAMVWDDGAGKPTRYNMNYVPTAKNGVLRRAAGAPGGTYATACNSHLFGFCAVPDKYNTTGIRVFIVNEEGVIYGVDRGNNTFITTWPGTDPTQKTLNGRFWSVVQ